MHMNCFNLTNQSLEICGYPMICLIVLIQFSVKTFYNVISNRHLFDVNTKYNSKIKIKQTKNEILYFLSYIRCFWALLSKSNEKKIMKNKVQRQNL